MKGRSMPKAPALASGDCETKSSGRVGQSMVAHTSSIMRSRRANCLGPVRTALAWKSRRMPRSPKKP
jgi:hypothetical protein